MKRKSTQKILLGSASVLAIVAATYATNYLLTKPSSLSLNPTTYDTILGFKKKIDTTIVPIKNNEYQFANTTNQFQTYFKNDLSSNGAIKFSKNDSSLSFSTPIDQIFGKLHSSIPSTSGNQITYPNVFPNIDFKYTISSRRLLEEIIVKSKDTATLTTEFKQVATTSNITSYEETDGSIVFKKDDSVVLTLPKPVLYEQDNRFAESSGIRYDIVKENDTYIIKKIITEEGQNWLASPERNYPIVVDIVLLDTGSPAWVSSDTTNTPVTTDSSVYYTGPDSTKITTATTASSTVDLMEYSSNALAQTAYVSNGVVLATGGTITTSGNFKIHTFTSSGTFTPNIATNVEALVVAGGGGGGSDNSNLNRGAGGGGGGGLLYNAALAVAASANTVTVGAGGAGGTSAAAGARGGSSIFSTMTTTGGGGGSSTDVLGAGIIGTSGGSGGGNWHGSGSGFAGTAGQGNNGGGGYALNPYNGGGGGGAGAVGQTAGGGSAGAGGAGAANSISGVSVTYAGGGGGFGSGGIGAAGSGGGGSNGPGANGLGGGGGAKHLATGGVGGSGVVILKYQNERLQAFSEPTIKTEGTYSLKGIAYQTTSANHTLTSTIVSPLNFSTATSVTFDIRSSRTGSNIKVGLRDSGGVVTEVTPNVLVANTFQSATVDLSAVTAANKDAINSIIITIVNAAADNTFYIDNMVATVPTSINDTVTLTKTAVDLSSATDLTFWVRSSAAGSFARFEFGEVASSEQTYAFTINAPNTWEQKTWDISAIAAASRNAVTKFGVKITSEPSGAIIYIDNLSSLTHPSSPTISTATTPSTSSINWNFTDTSSVETGFRVYDSNGVLVVQCATSNLSTCLETGLAVNTQYTRKVTEYNDDGESGFSSTASLYTRAAVPPLPTVSTRLASSVQVNPNIGTNPASTQLAIYKEAGSTCDGVGGSYIAANGSDNGSTAVWQTDAAWATVTATGLSTEQVYSFCVKARNGDNLETSFGSPLSYNGGVVPLGGDFPCQDTLSSNTLSTRYVDGTNPARYIIGVDTGSDLGASSTNTAKVLPSNGCALTINSTDTLVAGSLDMTGGGSISVSNGGKILLNQPVWVIDADGDGYTSDGKLYYGAKPVGGKRKNATTSLLTVDCADNSYSLVNLCQQANGTACAADNQCTSNICATNADADAYFSLTAGHTGTCQASALPYTDCNDAISGHNNTLAATYYVDADVDAHTFGSASAGATVCSNAVSWDLSTSASTPGSATTTSFTQGTRRAAASANADCGPNTATAFFGSSTCGTVSFLNSSGVASYDYDCSAGGGAGSTTGCTIRNYSATGGSQGYTVVSGSCNNCNRGCSSGSNVIYGAATIACGALGANCTSFGGQSGGSCSHPPGAVCSSNAACSEYTGSAPTSGLCDAVTTAVQACK